MKYEVEIDGKRAVVDLGWQDGRVSASVDGRLYDLDIAEPEPNVYTMFLGRRVYESCVLAVERDSFDVQLRGRVFRVRLIDRKHRRSDTPQNQIGEQFLVAPMPGKIVRVLAAPGDAVAAGQGIVVVEAMKMQNEVKSPKAGRVAEIRVHEGMIVTANHVLAVVD
jgi:acetyl/propionyl-CoA carboxylase alpha subunit